MKLWQGRMSGKLNPKAEDFNASFKIDQRMLVEDLEGSIAHAQMLGQTGIISQEESQLLQSGLEAIKEDWLKGDLELDPTAEDVHSFVENELTKRLGDLGKKLHTARSRNDQVATDLRLHLSREIRTIQKLLKGYIEVMLDLADQNLETIMPGYTHLQVAQPVSLAHQLSAYAMMALRDLDRLTDSQKRVLASPLGACALAGTSYPIDRQMTADLLGFTSLLQNSMDAVSDRDFVIESQAALAIIAIHLSRQAEELIIWSCQSFQFIEISDQYSTGSSIMPQKKNPDMAELIRGKSGRVIGNLVQSLVMLKGLPLAYAKDMQEDKESLFESLDSIKASLEVMTGMLADLEVQPAKMLRATQEGYPEATDLADYLVKKGIPFRDAHHIVAGLVGLAHAKGQTLAELPLEVYREHSRAFDEDLYQAIDLKQVLLQKNSLGGPAPLEVKRQLAWIKDQLAGY